MPIVRVTMAFPARILVVEDDPDIRDSLAEILEDEGCEVACATDGQDALRQLALGLAKIEGPKTVVYVSGGLGVPETPTSFDPLEPAMAAGQICLYAIHVEQSPFGQVRVKPSPTAVEDERLEVYGLENLTSAAGGTLVPAVGSLEGAFDRVSTEISGSYLLGVDVAASDRDGKAHAVAVKVSRPRASVRARK
jgi:hypothetical protein